MKDPNCAVCGAEVAPYSRSGISVCGPGCDRVLGDPEDGLPAIMALLVIVALAAIVFWGLLS